MQKTHAVKTLKQFVIVMTFMVLALASTAMPVLADDAQSKNSRNLLPLPVSSSYGDVTTVSGDTAEQRFTNLVLGAVRNVRYIVGAVAVVLLCYSGIRMVVGQGKEEEYTTQKRNILYAILGLAAVGFSGELVRILNLYCPGAEAGPLAGKDPSSGLPCTPGGFLSNPNAILRSTTLFNQRTQFIVTFIKYFIGGISVFGLVRSGLRLVTFMGNEEKMAEDKKAIFYNILGLLFILFADTAINKVLYKIDYSRYPSVGGAAPAFDAGQGVKEIAGFTNLIVTIATPIAILILLYGAFLYVTSASNEETQTKAKKLIFAVVVGMLIMYAAFAIVSTVISGNFSGGLGTVSVPTGQT